MADYPLINGRKFDHSSAEIELGAAGIFDGIESLSWDESLEPGIVRGTGAGKKARTRGEHDAEGSVTIPFEDFNDFIQRLVATRTDGSGYGEIPFNITATYSDTGMPTTTAVLVGCRITGQSGGSETGGDPAMVELSLDVLEITINDVRMVRSADSSALST